MGERNHIALTRGPCVTSASPRAAGRPPPTSSYAKSGDHSRVLTEAPGPCTVSLAVAPLHVIWTWVQPSLAACPQYIRGQAQPGAEGEMWRGCE